MRGRPRPQSKGGESSQRHEGNVDVAGEKLSVAVVCYRTDPAVLQRMGESLAKALEAARTHVRPFHGRFVLVVNDDGHRKASCYEGLVRFLEAGGVPVRVLSGHGNVGYARGHNAAASVVAAPYHLVLNPDVWLAPDSLTVAVDFLDTHPEAGLLAPSVWDERGNRQYLCRNYPSVADLGLRGFLPRNRQPWFRRRLARYELRGVCEGAVVWNPPLVSGCFMLFRRSVWDALGGFDGRYFLYFEDYDVSLRVRRIASVVYVPQVRIRHWGGGAASKGPRHVWLFCRSAARFFMTHGWKWA